MAFTLRIFGSSSAGNCALLCTAKHRVLIDAGLRINRLKALLGECGLGLDDIDAVFLTHDHCDHTVALRYFKETERHIAVFASRGTQAVLAGQTQVPLTWRIFDTGAAWAFDDLDIESFPVPHDGADPVGFVFAHEGRRLGWMTDAGSVTQVMRQKAANVHLLALESNYEKNILMGNPRRTFANKKRVDGPHGHLSNEAAFDFLESTPLPHCERVCLIHVSRECNQPDAVLRRFSESLFKPPYALEPVDPFLVCARPAWAI